MRPDLPRNATIAPEKAREQAHGPAGGPAGLAAPAASVVAANASAARRRTEEELGFPVVAAALAKLARSAAGKRLALTLPWLAHRHEVEAALARVQEAQALAAAGIELPAGPPHDLAPALAEVRKGGSLAGAQLVQVAQVAQACAAWRRFAREEEARWPALAELGCGADAGGVALGELAPTLLGALRADGTLRDEASAALQGLRSQVRAAEQRIRATMEAALQDDQVAPHLQDSFVSVRNGRYVLPVAASVQGKVPGIVHNASQTGQTLFVEPLFVLNQGNALVVLRAQLAEEEQRLLQLLSREVAAAAAALEAGSASLAALDVVLAAAELGRLHRFEVPTLAAKTAPLAVRDLRHPELVLRGATVVANDLVLEEGARALILSGPNAGGKTVTLRALGLSVRMLRAGLPVPMAQSSQVPLFDGLFADVGDAQDIGRGHSSFSAHLEALKEATCAAAPGVLVLLDEVGKDTDPSEGAALARAVLEHLLDAGATVVVTTHLEALKTLAHLDARFVNARMALDPTTLRPSHRLELGAAGRSHAFAVARRVGMPEAVVAHAGRLLAGGQHELAHALERLEAEHQRWATARTALARGEEELVARKTELAAQAEAAAQQAELQRQAAALTLAQALEQAAATLTRELAALRQASPSPQAAEQQRSAWHRQAALARQGAGPPAKADAAGDLAPGAMPALAGGQMALEPGSGVWVTTLSRSGEVVAIVGETATVALGGMRTRVPVAALRPLKDKKAGKPAAGPARASTRLISAAAQTQAVKAGRCDVRGLFVEQAAVVLTRALDACLSEGTQVLWVIHGHGTGVLREYVRQTLKDSPYVSHVRPGEGHEGGDGVTVVAFDSAG